MAMPFGTRELKAIFEPLGFTVEEVTGPPFDWPETQTRKVLPERASQFAWTEKKLVRGAPLWIEVWPNGFKSGSYEGPITVGVTGKSQYGMGFTGVEYKVDSIDRMGQVAAALVRQIEAHVGAFLCPKCYGLLVGRPKSKPTFFGCCHFENPDVNCRGTRNGPIERGYP
jgi:hypothetical protein